MRKIDKAPEPEFWKKFKENNPHITYKDLSHVEGGEEVRRTLRGYMIANQYHLCAYCCRKIDIDHSLNEHIKPEQWYPNDTMDYDNLIVSCKDAATCGPRKDNKYDPSLFVSPLEEGCERYFAYSADGEIHTDSDNGQYTVDLLGLNSYALKQARAAKYKACSWCDEEAIKWYLEPHDGYLEPFVDILEYFYKKGFYNKKTSP